jgi:hypothetical protein
MPQLIAIVVPPGVCALVWTHEVRALFPSRSRASTVRPVFDSTTGCLAIFSQIGSALISHPDAPAELEPLGGFAVESDCVLQAEKNPAPASKMIAPTINDLGATEKTNKDDRIFPPPKMTSVRNLPIRKFDYNKEWNQHHLS